MDGAEVLSVPSAVRSPPTFLADADYVRGLTAKAPGGCSYPRLEIDGRSLYAIRSL